MVTGEAYFYIKQEVNGSYVTDKNPTVIFVSKVTTVSMA
jgi:hypothetical protein